MRRLALLVLVLSGCGYRFAVGGPGLPEGIGSVHVPVFKNRSGEAEAGVWFASALAEELARSGYSGGPSSPARIEGVVESVDSNILAIGPDGRGVGLYRVEARVTVALVRGEKELCRRDFYGAEEFLPARELLGLEAARREALKRLAQRLMAGAEHELCPAAG